MPAPNKAKHKEATKAYVKARLDEGATYKELVREKILSDLVGTIPARLPKEIRATA